MTLAQVEAKERESENLFTKRIKSTSKTEQTKQMQNEIVNKFVIKIEVYFEAYKFIAPAFIWTIISHSIIRHWIEINMDYSDGATERLVQHSSGKS